MTGTETAEFRRVLAEFLEVVNTVGAMEPPQLSPVPLVHIVPLRRMRRRLAELMDP